MLLLQVRSAWREAFGYRARRKQKAESRKQKSDLGNRGIHRMLGIRQKETKGTKRAFLSNRTERIEHRTRQLLSAFDFLLSAWLHFHFLPSTFCVCRAQHFFTGLNDLFGGDAGEAFVPSFEAFDEATAFAVDGGA